MVKKQNMKKIKRFKKTKLLLSLFSLCILATGCEIPAESKLTHYYVAADLGADEHVYGRFATLEEAKECAVKNAVYGCRVFDGAGDVVYYPYTKLQCDILRESKRVTDYCRENEFTYGDAPINPAIDHTAKKVSCDRMVCWALYDAGFIDQPYVQGVVVSAMEAWCEKMGFTRIDSVEDLQAGDVVLVNPASYGGPGHTFIYAGLTGTNGVYYRYDCGSDMRIQSVQPFTETIVNFMFAYRPVER